jgi:hypothetical protein
MFRFLFWSRPASERQRAGVRCSHVDPDTPAPPLTARLVRAG